MKILLYNPDNGVTQNFMPHLWMFLLQSLTPAGNEVLLIDGNTHPMTDPELVQYALDQKIGLVGIGAMTRMIAKAYRVADALRAASVPVVEVNCAWTNSYSPAATKRALDSIGDEPVPYKMSHFVARIFFRGIYFPPKGVWQWLKLIAQNRTSVYRLLRESFTSWNGTDGAARHSDFQAGPRYKAVNVPSESKATQPVA